MCFAVPHIICLVLVYNNNWITKNNDRKLSLGPIDQKWGLIPQIAKTRKLVSSIFKLYFLVLKEQQVTLFSDLETFTLKRNLPHISKSTSRKTYSLIIVQTILSARNLICNRVLALHLCHAKPLFRNTVSVSLMQTINKGPLICWWDTVVNSMTP